MEGGWVSWLDYSMVKWEDRRRMSRNPIEIGVVFLYRVLLG